jgi:hypothetical protein
MAIGQREWVVRAVGIGAVGGALLLGVAGGGCVSKSKAEARARAAYAAGQREAMAKMQLAQAQTQAQGQGPSVTILGEVRNGVVPWTEGLTLRQALVAADYCGATDPVQIIVVHNGIGRQYDPKHLFNGPEVPMYPGDIVQLMTLPAAPANR